MARRDDDAPVNRPFLLLISACAIQSALIGFRWGYAIEEIRYVLPVMAGTLPPLVYASFEGLAQAVPEPGSARTRLHALPACLLVILALLWHEAIDLVLLAIYLGYAAALLRLAWRGPDALGLARLESALPAYRALQLAAFALVASALVDAVAALDLESAQGEHAVTIIAIANVLGPFALGLAATVAGRARPPADVTAPATVAPDAAGDDIGHIIAKVETLMRTQGLFRDANLNLDRLARKVGLPPRRVSVAINRSQAKSVSQYINGYRVAEVCRLLTETNEAITRIMFDAGFQTKSNFNREFRRVTGMSPVEWRAKRAGAAQAHRPH